MFPDPRTNADIDDEFSVTTIPSPTGQLEAHFEQPPSTTRAIVICHPHPQYGGSMHDAVVDTVDGVARRHGFATLRFNFRGVGASTGRFDNGVGEVDDLLAALTWLRDRSGTLPVWLAGYSFGSNIVWRSIARAGELGGALLIAPPVALMDFADRPASPAKGDIDRRRPGRLRRCRSSVAMGARRGTRRDDRNRQRRRPFLLRSPRATGARGGTGVRLDDRNAGYEPVAPHHQTVRDEAGQQR